jgi:hypothetical protein
LLRESFGAARFWTSKKPTELCVKSQPSLFRPDEHRANIETNQDNSSLSGTQNCLTNL